MVAPTRTQSSRALGKKLVTAALTGRTNKVQTLLARGAPLNTQDETGRSSLMHAAERGHLEIVKLLLDAGANPTLMTTGGVYTALSFAVIIDNVDIAQLLLNAGADPNFISSTGIPLPSLAILRDQNRMLEVMLDAGASVSGPVEDEITNLEGYTNLAEAALMDKPEAIKILLDRGAALSADTFRGAVQPLLIAAAEGFTEIVRLLMDDLSLTSPLSPKALLEGSKALCVAAFRGQLEVVDYLLDIGVPVDTFLSSADVEPVDYLQGGMKENQTPLIQAIGAGHLAVVERLIAAGADVNWRIDEESNFPMWAALETGKMDVMEVLRNAGADFEAVKRMVMRGRYDAPVKEAMLQMVAGLQAIQRMHS